MGVVARDAGVAGRDQRAGGVHGQSEVAAVFLGQVVLRTGEVDAEDALQHLKVCVSHVCLPQLSGGDFDQSTHGTRAGDKPVGFRAARDGRASRTGRDGAVRVGREHLLADGGRGLGRGPEVAQVVQDDREARRYQHGGLGQPDGDDALLLAVHETRGLIRAGVGHQSSGIRPGEAADGDTGSTRDQLTRAGQNDRTGVGAGEIAGNRGGRLDVDLLLEAHDHSTLTWEAVG
ncbi:hypothetical protein G6F68_012800 [Rhizopus microsporus]|nr:hypothetical protein G6F68_012800 [Rhizopus microsporus]